MKNSKFNESFWFTNSKNTFLLRFCREIIGKAFSEGQASVRNSTQTRCIKLLVFLFLTTSCGNNASSRPSQKPAPPEAAIAVGANRTEEYLPLIRDKRVGIVANPTSIIFRDNNNRNYTHLVDSLVSRGVNVRKVFAPEHGFRGTADAGEKIKDGKDPKTGLSVISLYGKNRKPGAEQLADIDVVIFDLQDVGVRFYTYISTLHYVMEACAENDKPLIVLDRPNPNGHFVDGPVLNPEYKSFVGMHPIPVAHGMTIGEYARMINGEKWLTKGIQCRLQVVSCDNYTKDMPYDLPIKPSPNLPNAQAVNLYPSLCFFEGTNVSEGRGTEKQFQVYGSPHLPESEYDYYFTPRPNFGAKNPEHNGVLCRGEDLSRAERLNRLELKWLIKAYNNTANKDDFFNNFFVKLAGTEVLQQQIEAGMPEAKIRNSWKKGLEMFRKVRAKYLLYEES
ncbi:DUF1343 domain-containing protein [Sinomicrobium kalidii]|uniref:exo-beta-N-acetylmuramidase NamZ family protein n=1 Tax=Sinomicrobium kalidii TaxID=2900738 RepID=UPI001E4E276B|nr:DUF1343 domain-containing protein [Sinomicrobium kalidii]UGU14832.1 DUF1343 domain-containing protein [Sinomicrobium kalidii]